MATQTIIPQELPTSPTDILVGTVYISQIHLVNTSNNQINVFVRDRQDTPIYLINATLNSKDMISGGPVGAREFFDMPNGVTWWATGTIKSGYLSTSTGASSMTPEVSVVLTVSGGATTALTQLAVLGGPAAIAAGAGMYTVAEDIGGRIIVPSGCFLGLTAVGAGTTHIVQSTIVFEEIPQ